ncbi:MAG TPA: hypothetical protein ENK02_00115 [Planctomycetes bacterium]|nr:hypothetical protein [Planctomycetota bacterium]
MPTEWVEKPPSGLPEEEGEPRLFLLNQRLLGAWCLLVLVCLLYVWSMGLKAESGLKKQEAAFRTMELLASRMRLAFPALSGRRTGENLRFGQDRLLVLLKQAGLSVRRGRGDWKVRSAGVPEIRIRWKLKGGRALALLEAVDLEGIRPLSMGL